MQATVICQRASGIAKGGTNGRFLAGQYLNMVLEELALVRNLQMNRITQMLTVAAASYGPFTLPANYLRTYDMFYPLPTSGGGTASTDTQFLVPITMEQFDAEFKSPSISNYPYEFAVDDSSQAQTWSGGSQGDGTKTSAGFFNIYPQSSGELTITHRYMCTQPEIDLGGDSVITPWFPNTLYLIWETAARMMGETGEDRALTYHQDAERILAPYLIQQGTEQRAVTRVELDPRTFKFRNRLPPTKAMPF